MATGPVRQTFSPSRGRPVMKERAMTTAIAPFPPPSTAARHAHWPNSRKLPYAHLRGGMFAPLPRLEELGGGGLQGVGRGWRRLGSNLSLFAVRRVSHHHAVPYMAAWLRTQFETRQTSWRDKPSLVPSA